MSVAASSNWPIRSLSCTAGLVICTMLASINVGCDGVGEEKRADAPPGQPGSKGSGCKCYKIRYERNGDLDIKEVLMRTEWYPWTASWLQMGTWASPQSLGLPWTPIPGTLLPKNGIEMCKRHKTYSKLEITQSTRAKRQNTF